jgi:putative membrane protein
MKDLLTPEEHRLIEGAVSEAESRTSGEIVPYIVGRSSSYRETMWKAAVQFGFIASIIIFLMSMFYEGWSLTWLFTFTGSATLIIASSVIGAMLVSWVPAIEKLFLSENSKNEAVQQRAMQAFVEEEVFLTRDRTGILLYISLLERRVEVFGDSGINEKVQPEDWAHVVEDVLLGIKSKSLGAGLADAIKRCGDLLVSNGFVVKSDDENELSDRVRLRKT